MELKKTEKPSFSEMRENLRKYSNDTKLINNYIKDWINVMANTNTYNNEHNTFTLRNNEATDYGMKGRIYAPYGLALTQLETLKPYIESGLGCKFLYHIQDHNQFALFKIVNPQKVKCNEIPFEPYPVKPYELYCGVDIAGDPIVCDINKTPHCLLAGQTRRGKNGSLYHMITSLVHSCSEKEVQLYLFQVAKNDLIKFADCKHTRCFVLGDLNQMAIATKHLIDIIKARTDMMIPMAKSFKGDNIFNYNKINKDKPMPYIYLIIDEFATLMPESSDPKEVKEIKNRILSDIKLIGQMGGAIGVTYIIAHQKPEKELCPTFIKNMSNIRICFGFEDAICSQIVLGNNLALDLPQRVAYYTIGEGFNLLYTTNLDDRILPFIQDKLSPSHRTLFDDLKKLNNGELPKPDIPESNKGKGKKNKNNQNNNSKSNENQTPIDPKQVQEKFKEIQQSKQPTTPLEFNNVNPNSNTDLQKKIAENISKIPNFVPYNPNKNGTVIDRTIISPSEMQKPIKNNKGDE